MFRYCLLFVIFFILSIDTSYAHGFGGSGFLHPLTGIDHLFAMVAVGLWSAQIGGRAVYLVPSCFLFMMAVGGIVGFQEIQLSNVEFMIALSVLLLGLAIFLNKKSSIVLAGLGVAIFGFFHGYAHGAEIPNTLNHIEYMIGFLVTTLGLHIIGAVSGLLILEKRKGSTTLRFSGLTIFVIGVYLTILKI
ncbi:HupE/UreJ family protein [Paenibacillus harenae]|uniref:HupE/UreJ family protein n=1 Tax=Paenibacillus harenae TaxID=306543 RepID=UPI0027D78F1B|nr:HupE/UreJ family protein [Paenibacillus harenae]